MLEMLGLILVGDGDPPRASSRGVITGSDLCLRTISLAAVSRGWIRGNSGRQGEL